MSVDVVSPTRPPARMPLILWDLVVFACLLALPLIVQPRAPWELPKRELLPFLVLWGAFAASAVAHLWIAREPRTARRLILSVLVTSTCFAFAFLVSLLLRKPAPRTVLVGTFVLSLLLLALPLLGTLARRVGWLILLVLLAGLVVLAVRKQLGVRATTAQSVETRTLATTFYPVELRIFKGYVPLPAVRGGGFSLLRDGTVLLGTGDGYVYRLTPHADDLGVQKLNLRVPLNGEEFAKDVGGQYLDPNNIGNGSLKDRPGVQTWRFRVAGVFAREHDGRLHLYASHHQWNPERRCFFIRVSRVELALPLVDSSTGTWETVYDSKPCLPIEGEGSIRGKNPFVGEEVGGRMALLDDNTLLLTTGEMGFSGLDSSLAPTQDPQADYGKTLAIDLTSRQARVFTIGHRNPQGLYIDPQGTIWQTEHGSRGGDELNVLRDGVNYGWPRVTYGTDYGQYMWPLTSAQGQHEGYEKPIFSWVPSIGTSNLIGIERDLFATWKHNLLVGSLATRSLYLIKIDAGRVVYSEPIPIEQRVRDLIELPDGRILIWADGGWLSLMQPSSSTSGAMLFGLHCGGCHTTRDGVDHRTGPDLLHIVGQDIASTSFTGYSSALLEKSGSWTPEALDAFIKDPQAFAPGTTMLYGGMPDDEQRRAVIEFLKTRTHPN